VTRTTRTLLILTLTAGSTAYAQTSSLMWLPPNNPANANAQDAARLTRVPPGNAAATATANTQQSDGNQNSSFSAIPPKDASRPGTRAIEMTSLIAVPPVPARKFKTNDLVNIIVRQQKKYQADGKANSKDEWNIDGKLSEWFHLYQSHNLGSAELRSGQPGFNFKTKNEYKKNADNEREDKFTTYLQATVIDVKPNGNLILEAKMEEQHDSEHFTITLTGTCRSEDVTPTNSVLSTQIANLVLVETNKGSVRDATKRGFFPRILDFAKPF
jgi:flagellar L-ring protein precursor FlgH